MSKDVLPHTGHLYLELALDKSIFYYEILNNYSVAKDIVDTVINDLQNVNTRLDPDSSGVLVLLTNKLQQWNCDNPSPHLD